MHEVIYLTLEFSSKPVYLAYIESFGGVCWSIVNADISLTESWLPILLDNFHLQNTVVNSLNISIRFLFQYFRMNIYSFHEFLNDLKIRDSMVLTN